MNRRFALPAVIAAVSLAACSAPGGTSPSSPSPDDSPGGAGGVGPGIEHPGDGELVLSVENRGGFVPVEATLTSFPSFVMLGDGRVIVAGPQTLIFPGPLLPPLQERRLTEQGIQQVLDEVLATGLFEEDLSLTGAQAMVADAAETVFTLRAGGRETTVSVYALGMLDPVNPPPNVTRSELTAHATLARLNDGLATLDTQLEGEAWADPSWQPYQPDAFRLILRDATGEPPTDPPGEVRGWSFETDPGEFGEALTGAAEGMRCGVVEGADAEAWLEELRAANQNTRWATEDGRSYAVLPRPLLPHEERTCPPPA
jgi:hypothetical protein